jgi:hypothetical protein
MDDLIQHLTGVARMTTIYTIRLRCPMCRQRIKVERSSRSPYVACDGCLEKYSKAYQMEIYGVKEKTSYDPIAARLAHELKVNGRGGE